MTEKQIETKILDYLWSINVFCWKHENNSVYDPKRGAFRRAYSKFKFAGISDIIGILPCGKLLAIEVKRPGRVKTLTVAQKNFLDRIKDNNGINAVVTSVQEVKNLYTSYITNNKKPCN